MKYDIEYLSTKIDIDKNYSRVMVGQTAVLIPTEIYICEMRYKKWFIY